MSVLVKGMKMPKDRGVYELILYVDSDGTATVEGSYCRFEGEPFEAVSVPPHGRLGNLDKLADNMRSATAGMEHRAIIMHEIRRAPTVIPADPAKEVPDA